MTPPEAPGSAGPPPAVSVRPVVLTKRADFLRAARARRAPAPGFILQARQRGNTEPAPDLVRVGYTCSKKVGNAVARNRAKRRLREAVRDVLPRLGRPGWDYVLIGKRDATAARPWPDLLADLERALARVHGDAR